MTIQSALPCASLTEPATCKTSSTRPRAEPGCVELPLCHKTHALLAGPHQSPLLRQTFSADLKRFELGRSPGIGTQSPHIAPRVSAHDTGVPTLRHAPVNDMACELGGWQSLKLRTAIVVVEELISPDKAKNIDIETIQRQKVDRSRSNTLPTPFDEHGRAHLGQPCGTRTIY